MGASFSTRLSESNIELRKQIDAAATKVILESNFTDLTKLANEKYCNRLVNKVATVFQDNKDTVDLEALRQTLYRRHGDKVEEDKEVDHHKKTPEKEKEKEKHNKKTKTLRVQNVERKCLQISKFYVLFAHLFSCIISTINPSASDKKEKTATTGSSKDKDATESSSLDFCSSRIDALVNGELIENSDGDLLVKPKVCKTNVSKNGSPLHLIDLPGMKALQQLYKDANDNDGGDGEMEDARYLYNAFTGKDAPDNIRRLDQVPLKVYNKDEECKEQKSLYYGGDNGETAEEAEKRQRRRDIERRELEKERMFYGYNERDRKKNEEENARTGIYLKGIVGSLKERLFSDYVQHIKEMMERAEFNRSRLLEILSEMFAYTYDSGGNIENVIINSRLTYKKLQSLVVQTRRIVIKLYTDCEEDYKAGLDIFFAMVQENIAMKLSVQEEVLKKQLEDAMYGPPERYIRIPEYPQQYQVPYNNNNNQFVPPYFRRSVMSIVKKSIPDYAFRQLLPELEEWINDEINGAANFLVAQDVADAFLKENAYGDQYTDENIGASTATLVSPSSASPSSSTSAKVVVSPPLAMTPLKPTPFLKTATSVNSTGPAGPAMSPSPNKIKTRALSSAIKSASAIKPVQLSFISEEE
jgi:hypothetical protein